MTNQLPRIKPHYATDRRCYNGAFCTDMERELDSKKKAQEHLKQHNARATYYPAEADYIGFIDLEIVTNPCADFWQCYNLILDKIEERMTQPQATQVDQVPNEQAQSPHNPPIKDPASDPAKEDFDRPPHPTPPETADEPRGQGYGIILYSVKYPRENINHTYIRYYYKVPGGHCYQIDVQEQDPKVYFCRIDGGYSCERPSDLHRKLKDEFNLEFKSDPPHWLDPVPHAAQGLCTITIASEHPPSQQ